MRWTTLEVAEPQPVLEIASTGYRYLMLSDNTTVN